MVASRVTCKAKTEGGESCRAAPMRDGKFCVFHDPAHAEVVQDARRAGGQRRKREATIATAYDFEGLESVIDIRRLVNVAALDALGLENSISRVRALGYLAQVAVTLLEKGELEDRLAAVEEGLSQVLKTKGKGAR